MKLSTVKFFLLACFSLAFFSLTFAQKKKDNVQPSENKPVDKIIAEPKNPRPDVSPTDEPKDQDIYNLAIKYNDVGVAINALYRMLAKAPTDTKIKDSIATLYVLSGAFHQAVMIGNDILSTEPTNLKILEMCAISEQSLGRVKEARDRYEKLYMQSKKLAHLYQVGIMEYQLKRYLECHTTLDQIINNAPEAEKIAITISQQQRQDVPLKAAAMNVKGVLFREQGRTEEAKRMFENSLKIMPDFALPKGNLEDMKKPKTTPGGGGGGGGRP